MAEKIILVDDLDGSDATETRNFTIEGVEYVIDLSVGNAKRFDTDMAKYTSKARRPRQVKRTKISTPQNKANFDAIRTWARGRGLKVSDRGRIPKDIVDQFNTQHEGSGSPAFSSTQ